MDSSADLPPDLAAAHAMILAERTAGLAAEARLAEAANAQAKQSSTEALGPISTCALCSGTKEPTG
ncbi:hypothetical protein ACM41_13015 [Bradyrhizobium sp. CCBAU 21362]|nr:hypothetical protein [Bradyrhizobium sp. CCBAU 21362]